MERDHTAQLSAASARLAALNEVHEHWEFEEAMTEAEFDDWLHGLIRAARQEVKRLSAALASGDPAPQEP